MDYNVTVIPGDGIGPEIVREAKKVMDKVGAVYGHTFDYTEILMGGCSIDAYGVPLTEEALETARKSDAVLLGAVGGDVGNSRWYDVAPDRGPRQVFWPSARDWGCLPTSVLLTSIRNWRRPAPLRRKSSATGLTWSS